MVETMVETADLPICRMVEILVETADLPDGGDKM